MNDGDTAEQTSHEDTMLLTEVPSGKTCKLVRVVRKRKGILKHIVGRKKRFGRMQEHGHRGHSKTAHQGYHGSRRILRRLLDLGITTGCVFQVVQGGDSGPVLVQVRGTRIALGHGLASKLMVRVVDE